MTRLQPTGRSRLCSAGLIADAADLYGLFIMREKHCSMAEKVGLILAYKLKRTELPASMRALDRSLHQISKARLGEG